jgi:hypothetical protein
MIVLSVAILFTVVLVFALYRKGEVKAALKCLGIEFSLETKEPVAKPNREP